MKARNYLQLLFGALSVVWFLSCKKNLNELLHIENAKTLAHTERATGRTFYVSSSTGDDNNSGLTENKPLKTLGKVSSMTFLPGDAILFKTGDIWEDSTLLRPRGSGAENMPITIDKYGTGISPILRITKATLDASVATGAGAVMLENQSYWNINNLIIIANYAQSNRMVKYPLSGIFVLNSGTIKQAHITVKNCTVTSFTGACGIAFNGAFDSILVENCWAYNVGDGIYLNVNLGWLSAAQFSTNVVFRNNLLQQVWGNGIVIAGINSGGLIEGNRLVKTSYGNGACIWLSQSTNSIVQYNEVSDQTGGSQDGEAFDDDNGCNGDIFQYNLSHNNAHGFMLLMAGSRNVTIRYNISVNDGGSTTDNYNRLLGFDRVNFHDNASIYNNIFYIGEGITTRIIGWGKGWAPKFHNNIFYVDKGKVASFSEDPLNAAAQFKNNCFYPVSAFSSATNYFTTQTDSIASDPLFVGKTNPASHLGALIRNAASYSKVNFLEAIKVFALQANSRCLNNGLLINNRGILDFADNDISIKNSTIGAIWSGTSISPSMISGATYTLVSAVNNTSVLDVTNGETNNGTTMQLHSSNGSSAQKWLITSIGGGYYKLKPLNATDKVLDVYDSRTTNGAQIIIWSSKNSDNQKWKISHAGNNYYTLSPANAPGANLDVNGGATENGTKIQLWTANGSNAQKWKLVKQ